MRVKTCPVCQIAYPLNNKNYYKQSSSKDGFKNICKKCISATADRNKRIKEKKTCGKCGVEKSITEFALSQSRSDGRKGYCKQCGCKATAEYTEKNKEKVRASRHEYYENNKEYINEKSKKWAQQNKERRREYLKEYHLSNKELINERSQKWRTENHDQFKESMRRWYASNREYCLEYAQDHKDQINKQSLIRHHLKYRNNPKYKLNLLLSTVIRQSIKNRKAGRHWESLVGYTLEDLMQHLEKQFQPGMTWENHREWHIDHKRPKASFNFNSPEDIEFKQCWALDNLQPLWAEDNLRKGNRII